jgi:hypothetical protein
VRREGLKTLIPQPSRVGRRRDLGVVSIQRLSGGKQVLVDVGMVLNLLAMSSLMLNERPIAKEFRHRR